MTSPLFDDALVPLRRARAERMGGGGFLFERAFAECLDRLATVRRTFRHALIYGHCESSWPARLREWGVPAVSAVATGSADPLPASADLCVSVGGFDTAEPLPAVLAALQFTLVPDSLLIGAFAGGDSLPVLRQAMRAADHAEGAAAAHVHPRIGAASFAGLLSAAGFVMPVVDVDRVALRYHEFDALVRDLRAMGMTNRLIERPRKPILRQGRQAARDLFKALSDQGRTTETVEIIHFAAWTPAAAD